MFPSIPPKRGTNSTKPTSSALLVCGFKGEPGGKPFHLVLQCLKSRIPRSWPPQKNKPKTPSLPLGTGLRLVRLGDREFRFIEHCGAAMGFVCGLLQLVAFNNLSPEGPRAWRAGFLVCVLFFPFFPRDRGPRFLFSSAFFLFFFFGRSRLSTWMDGRFVARIFFCARSRLPTWVGQKLHLNRAPSFDHGCKGRGIVGDFGDRLVGDLSGDGWRRRDRGSSNLVENIWGLINICSI